MIIHWKSWQEFILISLPLQQTFGSDPSEGIISIRFLCPVWVESSKQILIHFKPADFFEILHTYKFAMTKNSNFTFFRVEILKNKIIYFEFTS